MQDSCQGQESDLVLHYLCIDLLLFYLLKYASCNHSLKMLQLDSDGNVITYISAHFGIQKFVPDFSLTLIFRIAELAVSYLGGCCESKEKFKLTSLILIPSCFW